MSDIRSDIVHDKQQLNYGLTSSTSSAGQTNMIANVLFTAYQGCILSNFRLSGNIFSNSASAVPGLTQFLMTILYVKDGYLTPTTAATYNQTAINFTAGSVSKLQAPESQILYHNCGVVAGLGVTSTGTFFRSKPIDEQLLNGVKVRMNQGDILYVCFTTITNTGGYALNAEFDMQNAS